MYQKCRLDRLEKVSIEEYKILCLVRNRRKVSRSFRLELIIQDNRVKCREVVDKDSK